MNIRIIFTFIFFLTIQLTEIQAQKLQWASKLVFEFNQYGTSDFSGSKALGAPDAKPFGTLNKNAFRLKSNAGYGTLKVGYSNPIQVSQVTIVENNAPGNIVKIILYDTNGKEHVVYEEDSRSTNKKNDIFILKIQKTTYKVSKVAVHINTYKSKKWAQIDAIAISEEPVNDPVAGMKSATGTSSANGKSTEKPEFHAKKERLSDKVNTKYLESKPLISPDGKTLFFARKNSPDNIGGKRDDQDIYFSTLVNGEWKEARNIGKPLNDKLANGVCSVTPDGNRLVLLGAFSPGKGGGLDGVSISVKTRTGWSEPDAQEIEGFINLCDYQDYFLANSGKVMLMAIQMNETQGDQDLYVSFKTGPKQWSKPLNLGKTINTAKVEFAPFLASDNKTLYFSSNGHGGYGESDIFYTQRLDDTWQKWSKPINIGGEVNTPSWDGYYVTAAKGDYAYFISTSGTLKKVNLNPTDEDIFKISLREEVRPDPVILISGRVLNSITKKPLDASILYQSLPVTDNGGIAMTNPSTGEYKIVLPVGKKYGFHAEAKDYMATERNEDFTNVTEYKEIVRDLYLTPMAVGMVIQLNNLFFVRSKAEVLPESIPEMDRIYKLLVDYPQLVIELGGHTDNQGIYSANVKLSQDRADAVREYLVNKGIEKRRIKTKGYGPTKPIADNRNPETRKNNRRVEIKVLKH